MIDVVKGEGVTKDKPFASIILLGSDCYATVKSTMEEHIQRIDEWKEITCSTDL